MNGELLAWVAGGAAACLLLALLIGVSLRREERVAERIAMVQRRALPAGRGAGLLPAERPLGPVARLGNLIAGTLLSNRTRAEMEQTLIAAGFRGTGPLGLLVGAKVLLLVLLPALALGLANYLALDTQPMLLSAAAGGVLGLLLPEMIMRRMRRTYLAAVARGLPDGLDMMVICSEAGLGLEAAVQRMATEIKPAWPALANEMAITEHELRLLSDRRSALFGLGERTRLEPLRRLASVLIQTQQYGTPVTQALRTLSAELRQEQLIAFEARAARLPVLLTMPMILFILPTVFLVVAGPAVIGLLRVM